MLARVGEVIARTQERSAAAACRRDRRGDRSFSMARRRQFHPARRARLRLHRRRARARAAVRHRPRPPALAAKCGSCSAAMSSSPLTPEIREFLNEPKLIIITKANVRSRVHRRVDSTTSASSTSTATASLSASAGSAGCSPRPLTRARCARSPICGARSTASMRALRLRSGQPFRQGAGQRARKLSARRTVPDRRGHALPVRARHPAARRTAARARAAAPRSLRPLRVRARLRSARAL